MNGLFESSAMGVGGKGFDEREWRAVMGSVKELSKMSGVRAGLYKRVAQLSWIAFFTFTTHFIAPLSSAFMSSAINKAGKKLFARHLEQYTPTDPLYEEYVDKRGRTRRRKVRL